jgi:aryl-alcohol dehydrogenase
LPSRLTMAKELGATDVVNGKDEDALAAIKRMTGYGTDFALDTTGLAAVIGQAVNGLAPLGTAGFVASPSEPVGIHIRHLMLGGRKLKGIVEGESIPDLFIPALIEFHRQGRFPLDRLVTFYPFERINDALHDSHEGTAIKPILRLPN